MEDISKIINILQKKQYVGFVNIGSGKRIYLKDIAKIILKIQQKSIIQRQQKSNVSNC